MLSVIKCYEVYIKQGCWRQLMFITARRPRIRIIIISTQIWRSLYILNSTSQPRTQRASSNGWFLYVIIFLKVQFYIRLTVVGYRGKKISTKAAPMLRSLNNSLYTQNCIRNEPQHAMGIVSLGRLYHKAVKIDFVWCDIANNFRSQSSWRW